MKYEEGGFDPTPYDRILGGIHTPARATDASLIDDAEEPEIEIENETKDEPVYVPVVLDSEKPETANIEEVTVTEYKNEEKTEITEQKTELVADPDIKRVMPIDDKVEISRTLLPSRDVIYSSVEYTDICDASPVKVTVEEDILVPDIKPDMASILSMDGVIRCHDSEIRTSVQGVEGLNVTGDITLTTVYLPEKKSSEPVITIKSRVPFKADWKESVPRLATASVMPVIERIEYSVINERKFRARITVELDMREYVKKSISIFEGIAGEEVQLLREKISLTDVAARKKDAIEIREEIVLKDGMPEPEQILRFDIRTVENHKQVTGEKAVVNASIYYSILYLAKHEREDGETSESMPFMHQGKTEFTQFIPLNNKNDQAGSRITFDDSGLGIRISTQGSKAEDTDEYYDDEEEKTDATGVPAFVIEGNVDTTVEVLRNIESDVATDVYHNEKELGFESEEFMCGALEGSGVSEMSVREIVNIPAERGDIDRVIYVSARVTGKSENVEYGKENVSGNIETEILLMPAEGNQEPFRMMKTVPFRASMDIPSARSGMTAESDIKIRELRCDKINSKQIELSASVFASGMVYSKEAKNLIKNPAFLEVATHETRKPGMILYITKPQDDLWNIAKKFRTTMEKISRVNGLEEGDVLTAGKKLLIVK